MNATDTINGPWAILPEELLVAAAMLDSPYCAQFAWASTSRLATSETEQRVQAGSTSLVVLPFHGVAVQRASQLGEAFGLVSVDTFARAFRTAIADDTVSGIVPDIDSPGGGVGGMEELADELFRARARKPRCGHC